MNVYISNYNFNITYKIDFHKIALDKIFLNIEKFVQLWGPHRVFTMLLTFEPYNSKQI